MQARVVRQTRSGNKSEQKGSPLRLTNGFYINRLTFNLWVHHGDSMQVGKRNPLGTVTFTGTCPTSGPGSFATVGYSNQGEVSSQETVAVPLIDDGDFVIVINAATANLTGSKRQDKQYYAHTGFPGASRRTSRIRPSRIFLSLCSAAHARSRSTATG